MSIIGSIIYHLAATPSPAPHFNQNSVTPTWVGFLATFLVAAAVLGLCIDMVRRIRKVRYRGEIREQLEAERAAAEAAKDENGENQL